MNNTIIGTAGHVDHGKTLLIKALTDIDTDRLKEEKKRGITIELGFAYLTLPNGEKAGIIDVPGHEKFIKNMLAGAGSIDLALLVVAADEGFMPQTREHLGILSMLGIQRGLVALTKTDLVDPDWLELVTLSVEEELAGSFLEGAPIVPVSAYTGEGMDTLRQHLFGMLSESPEKNLHMPFRLPVDRIFSVDGFGTVITGTLIEGSLHEGDDITIFPSGLSTKARNIQVHGRDTDTALAGQRVAINLAGIKCADVQKGDALAFPRSMENSLLLDVKLDILGDVQRKIGNNIQLHLYHGARDLLCRLILLEQDQLGKGQSGYAQLRLSEPLAAKPGDRFVVRFYSPLETIGGGVILDPSPQKHKRGDEQVIAGLKVKEHGSVPERMEQMILDRSAFFPFASDIKLQLFSNAGVFDKELNKLLSSGMLYKIADGRVIHQDYLAAIGERCQKLLNVYHKENPLHEGMRKDELRSRLLPDTDQSLADAMIQLICKKGFAYEVQNRIAHQDFTVKMNDSHKKLTDEILEVYLEAGYATPSLEEVGVHFAKEKKAFKQSLDALVGEGALVVLTPQIFMHKQHYGKAFELFAQQAKAQGEVTLAQFRDLLGTSRKYAVALLEHFDKKGLTQKQGDARVLS